MASDRFVVPLEKKLDSENKPYFLGRLRAPVSINAENGVAFIIFTSEEGNEELQISNITKPKNKQLENGNGKMEKSENE